MREYASYLDASRSTDMPASDPALNVCDRHNLLRDTDVKAWVEPWRHCGERGKSLTNCFGSKIDWLFFRRYEEVEYKTDLWTFVRRFDGQRLPELGPSLVVFGRPSSNLYPADHLVYWVHDCDFELLLHRHARGMFDG